MENEALRNTIKELQDKIERVSLLLAKNIENNSYLIVGNCDLNKLSFDVKTNKEYWLKSSIIDIDFYKVKYFKFHLTNTKASLSDHKIIWNNRTKQFSPFSI